MIGQQHKVKTILFDAKTADEEMAHRFSETVGRLNMESAMSKALQDFDDTEEWICIDRIEIDAGDSGWENEEDLGAKILAGIKQQLAGRLSRSSPGYSVHSEMKNDTHGFPDEILFLEKDSYLLMVIREYLLTGVLAWRADPVIDLGHRLGALITGRPALVENYLRPLLADNETAVSRIIAVLDPDQLVRLSKIFTGDQLIEELLEIFASLEKRFPVLRTRKARQELLHVLVMSSANAGRDEALMASLLSGARIQKLVSPDKECWRQAIKSFQASFPVSKKLAGQLIASLEKNIALDTTVELVKQNISLEEENHLFQKTRTSGENENEEETSADLFINNSGLVLMNAALLKFGFEKLGWVRKGDFVNDRARHKAIAWMHYITHGEEKMMEYNLSLNKILCGVQPSELIHLKPGLTRKEKNQAIELLEIVAEDWHALKKITIGALRESFLQRNGKLKNEEGGWQLHVESRAYDILVESLPWTYSIIRFPWMTKPIYTQWQTRI